MRHQAASACPKSEEKDASVHGPVSYTELDQREDAAAGAASRSSTARETSLIQRMSVGDEDALGELYDRWRSVVFAVAVRIVGDSRDAEEVLEDTFFQAWRQAGRYDAARGSVGTWLVTIARSRALDRARSEGRRPGDVQPEAQTAVPESVSGATADAADVPVERAEQSRIVRDALAQLPAEQRQALELAYFGGLSQTDIAEQLSLPLGTVKTRLRLALRKLRDSLTILREAAR